MKSTSIAIVGAGPRGTSSLERLCASACDILGEDGELTIHVIDPYPPGPGKVWRTDQPPRLLMNTITSQVSLFTDESVKCKGPILPGPSLHEWAKGECWLNWGPDDYATRFAHGRYLEWVFDEVCKRAADDETMKKKITISKHRTSATKLEGTPGAPGDGKQTLTLEDGDVLTGLSAVILAQGHLPVGHVGDEADLAEFAAANGLRYFPPNNPADSCIDDIASGEAVLLRGLGLDFFDYLTLLTSRQGGRFEPTGYGGFAYRRSGKEPKIYAGSRRGIPYHARGDNAKGVSTRHKPLFLTPEAILEFNERAKSGNYPNFQIEIWPLISDEVKVVYYETLLRSKRGNVPNGFHKSLLKTLGRDDDTTGAELLQNDDTKLAEQVKKEVEQVKKEAEQLKIRAEQFKKVAVRVKQKQHRKKIERLEKEAEQLKKEAEQLKKEAKLLQKYNIDQESVWSWKRLEKPQGDRTFATMKEWNEWLLGYLQQDVKDAKAGNVKGPLMAALDVMRDIRNEVRLIVDHHGVEGASYRDDLVGRYTRHNSFLSIGPPRRRVEEMIALMEAGVLQILGPKLTVRRGDGVWFAESPEIPNCSVPVQTIIDARIPLPNLRITKDKLLKHLLEKGQCRPHKIDDYETGAIDITPSPYNIIGADGKGHPRRFAIGVPTEGVHWVTTAGVRPCVNSVNLTDTDAVARAALSCARQDQAA